MMTMVGVLRWQRQQARALDPSLGPALLNEDPANRAERLSSLGEEQSQLERHAEHPLAERHVGQHAVGQVRGGATHAPSVAGRTNSPQFARKGDKQLLATLGAARSQETVGVNPAGQVGAQRSLDVPGQARPEFWRAARKVSRCSATSRYSTVDSGRRCS
jgi:hypothetical protein